MVFSCCADLQVIVLSVPVTVGGDVFLNGVFITSSGTVTFDQSTIHVGADQLAINASCVVSNNSTIVVSTPTQSGFACLLVCHIADALFATADAFAQKARSICSTMHQIATHSSMWSFNQRSAAIAERKKVRLFVLDACLISISRTLPRSHYQRQHCWSNCV